LIEKVSAGREKWIMMLDVKSQNDEWSFENKFVSQKRRKMFATSNSFTACHLPLIKSIMKFSPLFRFFLLFLLFA
jgi:hypothetical protein